MHHFFEKDMIDLLRKAKSQPIRLPDEAIYDVLYTDNLISISETKDGVHNRCQKCKLFINTEKTKQKSAEKVSFDISGTEFENFHQYFYHNSIQDEPF